MYIRVIYEYSRTLNKPGIYIFKGNSSLNCVSIGIIKA